MTTTIAIDLDDPKWVVDRLRYVPNRDFTKDLADKIEAAADKRVIVLDVEQLGLDRADLYGPVDVLSPLYPHSANAIRAIRKQLDRRTPPRPPEPTGLGAVVEDGHKALHDGKGDRWVRMSGAAVGGAVWHRAGIPDKRANWTDIPGPRIEVLSEGVAPCST